MEARAIATYHPQNALAVGHGAATSDLGKYHGAYAHRDNDKHTYVGIISRCWRSNHEHEILICRHEQKPQTKAYKQSPQDLQNEYIFVGESRG